MSACLSSEFKLLIWDYFFRLVFQIDPSILGGLVLEFSQKVFDMSIKTRAQQMERILREPVSIANI